MSTINVGEYLRQVRETRPLVLNITNYVTVRDVANSILALGASPIMADEPEDVSDLAEIVGGVNLNIGTLNARSIEAMFTAGKIAKERSRPVLLDPVGAGAGKLRTNTAKRLLEELKVDVVRGNISEIMALAFGIESTEGVDANAADLANEDNLSQTAIFAKHFAERSKTIVAISGAIDLISDGERCYAVHNGTSIMSQITGTGCMLSGITTAFIAANTRSTLDAVLSASCMMGLAGEMALDRMESGEGNASFARRLIDALCFIDETLLNRGAKYEVF